MDEKAVIEAQKDPQRFSEIYENHFERIYAYVAWMAWMNSTHKLCVPVLFPFPSRQISLMVHALEP